MVKKVLVVIGLCLLAGYLVVSVLFFKEQPKDQVCSHFEVLVSDSYTNLVDLSQIEKQIDAKGLNPYGKSIKNINTYDIEQAILLHKMVKSVEVFVTSDGGIRAVVEQRIPVLRVKSSNGADYYIDTEAVKVPVSKVLAQDIPLVTGVVNEDFAKKELYEFALFLSKNDFWNNQIEQIVVLPNRDVKLIPLIGNHEIILGNFDGYKEKLDKLKTFYAKGLDEVGWNRYSAINLKYDKQVVGTKR